MSDRPTESLLAAIKGYSAAFDKDKRFDTIRRDLERVAGEASKLDPIADQDRARSGQTRGETRAGHGDQHREGVDRNIEERGDPAQGAKRGQVSSADRLDAEAYRHRAEDNPDEPPLKSAARRSREIFRSARRQARETSTENSQDDKQRKNI